MSSRFRVFTLLLPIVLAAPAFACDLCGCFLPSNSSEKGFLVGVAEQYSPLSDLFLDGDRLENRHNQYLKSSYTQLLVNYHFNPEIALQVSVPLIYRSFQRLEEGALQHGTSSGVGDVLLAGTYIPYQRRSPYRQFRWRVLAGLKTPTGNTDRLGEELMEGDETPSADPADASAVHGHDIALGSGSWDGLFGTDLFGRSGKWFFSARLQYVVRGRGDFDYRFGNDLLWLGGPGYTLHAEKDWALGLKAVVSGERKGEDQLGNLRADDTAVSGAYIGPSAVLAIRNVAVAELGLGLPVWRRNSGLQTLPGYRLQAGITWQLN
jgi:hypothetical protein